MSNKNQKIYSRDIEVLRRIVDEQENYIGRPYSLDAAEGVLTIYALPRKPRKQKREHAERDKRREKFERRG